MHSLAALCYAVVLLLSVDGLLSTQGARPNLIFLLLDDQDSMLGALDVMPTYVERLVRGGATFTSSYVGSPKCCPSRTSMLSGRFAQ